jgi:spore coat protein CotH
MHPLRVFLALGMALALAACGGDGGSDGEGGSGKTGPDPFDETFLATYDITLPAAEWSAMVSNLEDNTWRHCTVVWRGETYADVGIHPAGQSSREPEHSRKPSVWLSFKEFVPGREFHGYERVKLDAMADDPAMVRERLAYSLYAARGVPAPRIMHCKVNINGAYLGLYVVEERVNKEFVTKRFGKTTLNQVYKWTEQHADFDYQPGWPGTEYAQAEPLGGGTASSMWEARIETLPPDGDSIRELARLINQDPANAGTKFDIDEFINFMAVEVASGETDGYIGNNSTNPAEFYTGNIYLYQNPANGKYVVMVWDRDQSFWRGPRLPTHPGTYDDSITFGFAGRILTQNLILQDPGRLAQYKQALREVADQLTHPSILNQKLDAILAQVREAAIADSNRLFATTEAELNQEWDDELRPRFQRRYNDILQQLGGP